MNEYQKEQAAKAEKFDLIVASIADALQVLVGGKVELEARHPENLQERANLRLEQGRGLHLHRVWNTNRLNVSGSWPRTAKGEVYSPSTHTESEYSSISVSLDRSPESIAKDIQRRFLPGYFAEYQKQAERAKGSDTYANDTSESLGLAAKALGVSVPGTTHGRETTLVRFSVGESYGGEIEAHGKEISIKVRSLSRVQALAICKLISTLK